MSQGLTPFPISGYSTGLYSTIPAWLRPIDAFQPLTNAYVYNSQVIKRNGYTLFGTCADTKPVMGIMQWVNETNATTQLVVATTRNAYFGPAFTPITTVKDAIFYGTTQAPATGTLNLRTLFVPSGTVTVTAYDPSTTPPTFLDTMTAAGTGAFAGGGVKFTAAGSSINYATGLIVVACIGSTANENIYFNATLTNYFTGDNTNFFNWTNWQPTNGATGVETISYLYMTNNIDPLTLVTFDQFGLNPTLSRPVLYIGSDNAQFICRCLDVKVFKNRLLLVVPTLETSATSVKTSPINQGIVYSAEFDPSNFLVTPGNGGFQIAATGDIIQATEFLRDSIIVFFAASTWIIRFTGNQSQPFRFDILNITRNTKAPYGTIAYDEQITSIGNRGLIFCDGTYVDRYDLDIIRYYENEMDSKWYGQSFGQRYDNLNQAWMLYVSQSNPVPTTGLAAPGADSCLIYNYLEKTWATYVFATVGKDGGGNYVVLSGILMTCMGTANTSSGTTWNSLTEKWDVVDRAWNSYAGEEAIPVLLCGDVSGNVYHMDNQEAIYDNQVVNAGVPSGIVIQEDIISTRWNPIISVGQKVQFAYIDIYYQIISQPDENPIQAKLNFKVDNSSITALSRFITLDGPQSSDFAWQRVYLNLIGEFIQMEIDMQAPGPLVINGMILWAKPAGRLTPGGSI